MHSNNSGISSVSLIYLFTCVEDIPTVKDLRADKVVNISAKKEIGFDAISSSLEEIINNQRRYIETVISYDKAGMINKIRKCGTVLEEDYREDGIFVRAYVDNTLNI